MPFDVQTAGEVYTLRFYKKLATNPAVVWANTYEIYNQAGGQSPEDIQTVLANISAAEKTLHLNSVVFDRAVASTWVPDGEPYNPASFITYPLSGAGSIVPSSPALGLSNCLQVRRVVTYGRNGRSLYRGCLAEGQTIAPAGDPVLTSGAYASFADKVADLRLLIEDALFSLGYGWVMAARYGESPTINRRAIEDLILESRVTVKKLNNRYFDVP